MPQKTQLSKSEFDNNGKFYVFRIRRVTLIVSTALVLWLVFLFFWILFIAAHDNAVEGNNYDADRPALFHGNIKEIQWSGSEYIFSSAMDTPFLIRRAPLARKGSPLPMPLVYKSNPEKYFIPSANFSFKYYGNGADCDLILKALVRYKELTFQGQLTHPENNLENLPLLTNLEIKIMNDEDCSAWPSIDMQESYTLNIKQRSAFLFSRQIWGALRGLETFSQLVFFSRGQFFVHNTWVDDAPRFKHRGVMIDTSRHFLPKPTIFKTLDAMSFNKLNVLHWHMVDDQSFPFQSEVLPQFTKGAFHETAVYTKADILEILEYARLRGIRVIPEVDTPGHVFSWGEGFPHLLANCYNNNGPDNEAKPNGDVGPLDPSSNETYKVIEQLFTELTDIFPDQYFHVGGDEVPPDCWFSNPNLRKFAVSLLRRNSSVNEAVAYEASEPETISSVLWSYYEYRLERIMQEISQKSKRPPIKPIAWQEVFDKNIHIPKGSTIHVWKDNEYFARTVAQKGYDVLFSSCWYLNIVRYGTDWPTYYLCDPIPFDADVQPGYGGSSSDTAWKKRILGGDICMWSEYVDEDNLHVTLWPRASAGAERLWSARQVRNQDKFAQRLQEHRCRMRCRNIPVKPLSGPDYCTPCPGLKTTGGMNNNQPPNNNSSRLTDWLSLLTVDIPSRTHVPKKNRYAWKSSRSRTLTDCSLQLIVMVFILIVIAVYSGRKFLTIRRYKKLPVAVAAIGSIVILAWCVIYFVLQLKSSSVFRRTPVSEHEQFPHIFSI